MAKRVVITGMGTVNPLGNSIDEFWTGIKTGRSGVGPITKFDPVAHPTRIAAEVKNFEVRNFIDAREARKMESFSHYAVASAVQSMRDAGLERDSVDPDRLGVILGVGIGGFETLEKAYNELLAKGPSRVPPMTVPKLISNIGPGNIAIMFNAQGPTFSLATACASGTDAISNAYRYIVDDTADVIMSGGVEACITALGLAGFNAIGALSTHYNDAPQRASRPFDRDRDGFVMGEGAGVLVLEELDHALRRNARIYAEVIGSGASTDANHLTAPHPEGRGAKQAMRLALRMARMEPAEIDYINAHGTSTQINDPIEVRSVKEVFGSHAYQVRMSSTKSMTGHLIGAAGAIEAIISTLAIRDNFCPPTINLDNPDPECDLNHVAHTGESTPVNAAMSISLGFGGHNSVLILKRYSDG